MYVCSKCGTHYNQEFLQCPQCGSTKRKTESDDKNNNSIMALIVTFIVVLAFGGIIAYGVYFIMHPFTDGPQTSDLDQSLYTTTETSSIETTKNKTTQEKSETTTTTKLVGTEGMPLGGTHTFTMPEGFSLSGPSVQSVPSTMPVSADFYCMSNGSEDYCLSITDSVSLSVDATNKALINDSLKEYGFSEIISTRLHGALFYYFYKEADGNLTGVLCRNKDNNFIYSTFNIKANKVDEDSMSRLINIINTIK